MFVEEIGPESEEKGLAVIGGVHGDEPCGEIGIKDFFEDFQNGEYELKRPVKLIIANEEALEKGVRYVDADLNRVFPGDPDSEVLEERLAYRIRQEVEDYRCIALHSTHSYPKAIAVIARRDETAREVCKALRVTKAIDTSYISEGRLVEYCDCVDVECGYQGSKEAAENAYDIILDFLTYFDALERPSSWEETETIVYEIYDSEDKDKDKIYQFLGTNFEKVEKGDVFALGDDQDIIANEDFYPALMSSEGYTDIIGYKAKKIGKLSEL